MQFRFQARRVFLTYSDVSAELHKEAVYYTIDERYPIKEYFISEERHEAGGRHIHAAIEFTKKVTSINCNLFDVNDGENNHHPNIQTIKKGAAHWERVLEYCDKEDPCPFSNTEIKPTWGEMLEKSHDDKSFMELVKRHYPRDFCLNHSRLEAMSQKVYPPKSTNTIESFIVTWDITLPPELTFFQPLESASTVVVGRPGCGKTTWAKIYAPKPTLFIRHLDSLQELRPIHRSIIFDDLDFKHLPPPTQKFLVDQTDLAEIHIRYRVAKIAQGITRIFTANEYPFCEEGIHAEAVRRRCNCIFIQ